MFIVESYGLAVALCWVTMLCWGSWGNTQKLAAKTWRYELFYWDYVIGIVLFSLIWGLTLGSTGEAGRGFIQDLLQVSPENFWSAFLGGVIFNASNILLSASMSLAGMSVAFPIGVGLALVLGVFVNYFSVPKGDPVILFLGVFLIKNKKDTVVIARRLQKTINQTFIPYGDEKLHVTMSIGITAVQEEDTMASIISRADQYMYRAKNMGRNTIITDYSEK